MSNSLRDKLVESGSEEVSKESKSLAEEVYDKISMYFDGYYTFNDGAKNIIAESAEVLEGYVKK